MMEKKMENQFCWLDFHTKNGFIIEIDKVLGNGRMGYITLYVRCIVKMQ